MGLDGRCRLARTAVPVGSCCEVEARWRRGRGEKNALRAGPHALNCLLLCSGVFQSSVHDSCAAPPLDKPCPAPCCCQPQPLCANTVFETVNLCTLILITTFSSVEVQKITLVVGPIPFLYTASPRCSLRNSIYLQM